MSGNSDNANTEPNEVINALVSLPSTTKDFEAGGHRYYVEETLSVERYRAFQKMEIELGMGMSFSVLIDRLKTAFDFQNKQKFAEVSVLIYQLMEGAVLISAKEPTALWVATLFINRADEDRTVWSKTLAEEKLKDWRHIESNFFLLAALNRSAGFKNAFSKISQLMQTVGEIKQEMTDEVETELSGTD